MRPTHYPVSRSLPIWQFLNQPLFSSKPVIWNPGRFCDQYHRQYLELCWNYETVDFLECCWTKEFELENPANPCIQK